MKNKTHWIFFIGMIFSQCLTGQAFTNDTIPFRLTNHNNIAAKAVLNGIDSVVLMFHTAANDISLIKDSVVNMSSMEWSEAEKGNSWGGQGETRFSENNSLEISEMKWNDLVVWENRNSGPTTAGKFGPNLFEDQFIEIDFDARILIIHKTLPSKSRGYKRVPLTFENGLMFIEGTSKIGKRKIPNRFLIHSGYSGAILYDDKFAKDNNLADHIEITAEQEMRDSYDNVLKTKKGKVSKFWIDKTRFKEIPVGFFEGAIGKQKISVIGGNVLKRFNLIIDAKREYIYLKPNGLMELPYKNG